MYNNSLHGFHSCKYIELCYKKITREYRLVRDFNFIVLDEVSQSGREWRAGRLHSVFGSDSPLIDPMKEQYRDVSFTAFQY